MQMVLRWFFRGVHSLYGGARSVQSEEYATFERVDSAQIDAGNFHASAAMCFDAMAPADFLETLPGYALSMPPVQPRRVAEIAGKDFA
jgi:hypothetical protein